VSRPHQLSVSPPALPAGVRLRPLATHADPRGSFTEVFREEWEVGVEPVQWNVVRSAAGVLRGVHVHPRHGDYFLVVGGRALVGLRDLRRGSPTEGLSALVELRGDALAALTIPPGVAHGFYLPEPSIHLYSVSHYWDPADELGCHWRDPALGIPWPCTEPLLSPRDAEAAPLADLLSELEPWQPIAGPPAAPES
jgi:dTDP-4-dehydrorhamnose 3,5-epimerase